MAKVNPSSSRPAARDKTVRAICALLAAVTLVVFLPAVRYDFVNFDDPEFVTNNPNVLNGLSWEGIAWAFKPGHGDYWHPIAWLSLMLDATLFGAKAGGYHFTNILLHAANAALLFLLLHRWTGAPWRSAFAAALFALHPLRVESVAWITERKDVLSTLFLLLTLWAYTRHTEREAQAAPRARGGSVHYGLALLFFALGLMSKAMLITLPFLMLLLDYWPLGRMAGPSAPPGSAKVRPRSFARLVREKVPFFALTMLSTAITYSGQMRVAAEPIATNATLWIRFENALIAYVKYLAMTFWPVKLSVWYPHPGPWPRLHVIGAGVLVAGLCLAAFWFARKRPVVFVGWFWFWGSLVPVIGLQPGWVQYIADRFTYVPSIGLFLTLVWLLADLVKKFRLPPPAVASLAAALLLAFTARTLDQLQHWKNSGTLYTHALAVTKNNDVAWYDLGVHYLEINEEQKAYDCFQRAIQINPAHELAHYNLGLFFARAGRHSQAIDAYRAALRIKPGLVNARNNLASVLAATGKLDEAIAEYRTAVRLNPGFPEPHNNLANALLRVGNFEEAISEYRAAIQLRPNLAELHSNLADALAQAGRREAAVAAYGRVLELKPGLFSARVNLIQIRIARDEITEAVQLAAQGAMLHPQMPEARFVHAFCLARQGNLPAASVEASEALRLKPGYQEAEDLLRSIRERGQSQSTRSRE